MIYHHGLPKKHGVYYVKLKRTDGIYLYRFDGIPFGYAIYLGEDNKATNSEIIRDYKEIEYWSNYPIEVPSEPRNLYGLPPIKES